MLKQSYRRTWSNIVMVSWAHTAPSCNISGLKIIYPTESFTVSHNSHHSSTNHQLLFVSTINEWKVTAEVWKLYFCFEIYLWRKILDGSECVKTILLRFWRQSFSSFPGRQPWSWMAAATHCPERNDQDHDNPSSWENPEKS